MAKSSKKSPKGKRWKGSAFPDHREMEHVSETVISTRMGKFTIHVFKNYPGDSGRFEIEIHDSEGGQATTTKTFSTVSDAISRGETMIAEAIAREEAAAKKAKAPPTFAKRDALDEAEDLGWKFVWEDDWTDFEGTDEEAQEIESVMSLVLKDSSGRVLDALGGIAFAKGESTAANQKYARDFELEMAENILAEMKRR